MPNLVVYVPADVARALEVRGVSEDVQRRACREVLVGLADGGLGAGGSEQARPVGADAGDHRPPAPSSLDAVSPDNTQGVRVGKASFRPDPKRK